MSNEPLRLVPTGVPSLDTILDGGIPLYSVNIIAGSSGSGKTILTQQILFHNCHDDVRGIFFTTLSEPAFKMIRYQQQFAYFDLERLNQNVFFVDIGQVLRTKSLDDALRVINQHVEEIGAQFIAIDSFKAVYELVGNRQDERRFGYDLAVSLATWTCTSFLVGEYTPTEIDNEPIFAVADGIFYLNNPKQGMQNVRRLNILKMRGMSYFTGDHPFTISSEGMKVYPRIRTPEEFTEYDMMSDRVAVGVPSLDAMIDNGFPRGTTTMVAGAAGTGKTLLGLHFIVNGGARGEPGVIVTFQENPVQLREIARSFGWDLRQMEAEGMLAHLYNSPVEIQPDIHTDRVKMAVERVGARRVLIDSLRDLEIATPDKVRYRDYVYSLVEDFKRHGITTLITNEIAQLFGEFQLSEHGISFIADNVILLRYVELEGRISRALSILKMRGSFHDKTIRELLISNQGIAIGEPIKALTGILTGTPVLNESFPLTELSPRSRYVLAILRSIGPASAADLETQTGLWHDQLTQELDHLLQNGLAETAGTDGVVSFYKATI
jgi:circadian clock protein KaiC